MEHSPGFLALVNDAKSRVNETTVGEVQQRLRRGDDFVFIDTREEHEWNEGHAVGAIFLSKGIIEREVERLIPDKSKEIVLYCGGGYRSALAGDNLQKMGYANVYSMAGGWKAWQELNGIVETKGKLVNMLRRILACLSILSLFADAGFAAEHPLLVGVRLAETQFKYWTYGHRTYRRQVNCVQFISAVVEDLLQRPLEPEERNAIHINTVGRRRDLSRLIRKNDERIRGIQTALLRMGKGEIISPTDAKPGDFIQFWRQRNGRWFGHVAIITEIENRNGQLCSLVFGAHQSLHGVGVGNFEVGLTDPALKVYLVRFTS